MLGWSNNLHGWLDYHPSTLSVFEHWLKEKPKLKKEKEIILILIIKTL